MTGITLMGRLGNIFFGLATGETWRKDGADVVYTNVEANFAHFRNDEFTKTPFTEYYDIFTNLEWKSKIVPMGVDLPIRKAPFHYSQFVVQDGVQYHGLFQSEKNFPDHEYIRELFKPSERVEKILSTYEGILGGNTCSIHVRRGDYVKLSHIHPVQGMDYYNLAMDVLNVIRDIDKYIVFSDDIEWCKENFKGDDFIFVKDKDYVELFLMSRCTYHIIGNSSFSWWGAWLGEEEGRTIIIAPKKWFGPSLEVDREKDIVPERWIRI